MGNRLENSLLSNKGDRESNLLSKGYVFYDNLEDYGHEALYKRVENKFNNVREELHNPDFSISGAKHLREIAKSEYTKEKALIEQKLNIVLPSSFEESDDSMRNLIETLNAAFGLKEIYERNAARIARGEAKINITQLFSQYFLKYWKKNLGLNTKLGKTLKEAVFAEDDKEIKNIIKDIVGQSFDNAIIDMLQSSTFRDDDEDNKKKVYADFLKIKDKLGRGGIYGELIYKNWGLQDFIDTMTNSFKNNTKEYSKFIKDTKNASNSVLINGSYGQKLGEMAEIWQTMIMNELENIKGSNSSVKWRALKSGGYSVKPDLILGYGIDLEPVQEILSNSFNINNSRTEFKTIFEKIGQYVNNFDKGFLVYENTKSYMLVSKDAEHKFDGFRSGEGGSVDFLKQLYKEQQVPHSDSFFTLIVNTAKRAMGNNLKPELEKALSQDIAWFLFDDYNTIGEEYSEHSGNILHIFNLNGTYIPLSVFLFRTAQALESVSEVAKTKPTSMVNVSIKTQPILYYDGGQEGEGIWTHEDWLEQREASQNETHISAKFFKSFADMFKSFYNN